MIFCYFCILLFRRSTFRRTALRFIGMLLPIVRNFTPIYFALVSSTSSSSALVLELSFGLNIICHRKQKVLNSLSSMPLYFSVCLTNICIFFFFFIQHLPNETERRAVAEIYNTRMPIDRAPQINLLSLTALVKCARHRWYFMPIQYRHYCIPSATAVTVSTIQVVTGQR